MEVLHADRKALYIGVRTSGPLWLKTPGAGNSVLRISTTHSFAMKWLVPRLFRFTATYPQLELRVDASDQVVALDDGSCDVAVRYGPIGSGGTDVLYRERLVVAYSPALHDGPNASLARLLRHPLLYEGTPELWLRLLEANRVRGRHRDFSRSYNNAGILVQAAVAGLGVALLPYALACEDIAQGRLRLAPVAPLASDHGYRLLCSADRRAMAKVAWFSAWIRAELNAIS